MLAGGVDVPNPSFDGWAKVCRSPVHDAQRGRFVHLSFFDADVTQPDGLNVRCRDCVSVEAQVKRALDALPTDPAEAHRVKYLMGDPWVVKYLMGDLAAAAIV